MKVLIICDQLDHGGAGRVATMIANGLSDLGHEIVFLTNLNKSVNYTLSDKILLSNFLTKDKNGLIKFIKAISKTRHFIRQTKPDVIIGIMMVSSLVGWISSRGFGIPVVATEHSSFERPDDAPMPLKLRLSKFYLNKIYDCVTVLTEADAKVIGKKLGKVIVMPNAHYLKPNYGDLEKKKIILACGRIYDWFYKGFDILIKAWGQIYNRYPEWKVMIVGDSNEKSSKYLKELCKENGVDNSVIIVDHHSDVLPLYREAEVFVLSSRYEAFGLVVTESMSQQCACVVCDYKGRQAEIIDDGQNGVLCKCGNSNALAQAISRVLDDNSLRKKLQKAAVVKSELFTQDRIAKKWEKLLNDTINRK